MQEEFVFMMVIVSGKKTSSAAEPTIEFSCNGLRQSWTRISQGFQKMRAASSGLPAFPASHPPGPAIQPGGN
jgi:hypothetical protein